MPQRPDIAEEKFSIRVDSSGDTYVCVPKEINTRMHRYIMELEDAFERCGGVR